MADPHNPGRDPERDEHTIVDTFDTLNRRTQRKLGTTGPVYTYGYNAKDELTSANDPTGEQPTSTSPTGGCSRSPAATGSSTTTTTTTAMRITRKFPDGTTVTADYDKDDRIKELTAAGSTWNFDYDPAGRRTEAKVSTGGLVEKIDYDRAGRLSSVDTTNASGTIGKYALDLDPAGNPQKITTTRGSATEQVAYKHDPANRLTDACYGTATCDTGAAGTISYSYDLVGNRKTQIRTGTAGSSSTTYDYDAVDQLRSETTTGTGAGTKAYKYDSEGNQIEQGADRFEYNLDHTLLSATVGGQKSTYTYNAGGQRLTATTGTNTRTWDWDVNGELPQIAVDRTGDDSRTFVHDPATGDPLALREGEASSFYVHDWLGGISALVGEGGEVQNVYDYDPYGLPRTSPTQSGLDITPTEAAKNNPLKFTGQYQDPTAGGDYYMRARMYDAGTGTFTSVDPENPAIGEPAMSTYSYANGHVLTADDPSGRSLKSWLDDTGDWLKDRAEDVGNAVESTAGKIADEVQNAAGVAVGAGDWIGKQGTKAGKALNKARTDFSAKAKKMASEAGRQLNSLKQNKWTQKIGRFSRTKWGKVTSRGLNILGFGFSFVGNWTDGDKALTAAAKAGIETVFAAFGAAIGGWAGAPVGGAVGGFVGGPPGAAVGATIGGGAGALAGGYAGGKFGKFLTKRYDKQISGVFDPAQDWMGERLGIG